MDLSKDRKMSQLLKAIGCFVVSAVVALVAGCGDSGSVKSGALNETKIPECGFYMNLPPGWVTEEYRVNEYYKRGDEEQSWGMAKFCPMSGGLTRQNGKFKSRKFEDVSEFVRYLIEEDKFQGTLEEVISQRPMKIGEIQADAHQVIYRARIDAGIVYVFDIYIEMEGGELLQVFFQVPGNKYQEFSAQYPAVVKSIRLAEKKVVW